MTEQELYIKAAKVIASCPTNRLSYVLETLKMGGLEYLDDDVEKIRKTTKAYDKTETLKRNRKDQDHEKWLETDNPYILKLREAYDMGISLTKLGRICGLHKTTLYHYLYAERIPSRETCEMIVKAAFEMMPELANNSQSK